MNLDIVNVKIDIDNIDICDEINSRGVELSDNFFYSIIKKYKQDNNFKGVFLGLRKEESRARRINFYKKGHTYRKKDGEWVCNPLSNFTAKDIYAFLLSNNINPLRVYMHTHFCSPEKIRKSWYLPGARACEGQALILKYYYPQLFNILEQKFKRIRQYL